MPEHQKFAAFSANRSFSLSSLVMLGFALLLPACGCQSFPWGNKRTTPLPTMFETTPGINELTTAVFRNSQAMRSVVIEDAAIRVPDSPIPLKATISLERPKRIRVRGRLSNLMGEEIDLGSNDELFWVWWKRDEDRNLYFARHEQFATSPMRQAIAVDPAWMLEAMGMLDYQAGETYSGPYQEQDGTLMFVTQRPTPAGTVKKKTTIDARTGAILRQEMYSPNDSLVAESVSSNHVYDHVSGILYARHVEIAFYGLQGSTQNSGMRMSIDIPNPKFNTTIPSTEFAKPSYPTYPDVDLCGPEIAQRLATNIPAGALPAGAAYQAPTAIPYQAATSQTAVSQATGASPTTNSAPTGNPAYWQASQTGQTPAEPAMGAATQTIVR